MNRDKIPGVILGVLWLAEKIAYVAAFILVLILKAVEIGIFIVAGRKAADAYHACVDDMIDRADKWASK